MENYESITDPLAGLYCTIPLIITWFGAMYYGGRRSGFVSKLIYGVTGSITLWLMELSFASFIYPRPLSVILRFIVTLLGAVVVSNYLVWRYIPNRINKRKRKVKE